MTAPNISEIATTTIHHRSKKLADNVSDNNAILTRLKQRGKIRTFDGGETIREELAYADNSTFKYYSGYEILDISPNSVFTSAEFDIKQAATAVSISGREMLQNSGMERMIDLLDARIENAEVSMENGIAEGIHSDGTGDGGKQIGGLRSLVSAAPTTGTVGGISRADWDFWQNQYQAGGTLNSANVQSRMNEMYAKLSRGMDKVDLIIADNEAYNAFLGTLQDNQRFTSTADKAMQGFNAIRFQSADVVLDGGVGGNTPSKTMYFLNCRYIHYRPHRDRMMVPLGADRYATNQDALVKLIGWAGNMTLSNAKLQGRVTWS